MRGHFYIDRRNQGAVPESFYGDPVVSFLYSRVRENTGWLYNALTSSRLTDLLGVLHFDLRPPSPALMRRQYARHMGIRFAECAAPPETLDTPRKIFERQIRYWDFRPMDSDPSAVVAPADARVLVGSLDRDSSLFLKDKFFDVEELLGRDKPGWRRRFRQGAYAVFRLTPDKYHYCHAPAGGVVRDVYEIEGRFQSCHPAVVVAQATPHSKNRRTVTILDTDVPGGSQVGHVAMVEVVALMIGDVVQCYSSARYQDPRPVEPGMRLERGAPKSLFRPGSSTVVLLFDPDRVRFCPDLIANRHRGGLPTFFGSAWGSTLVETDIQVRSTLAHPLEEGGS